MVFLAILAIAIGAITALMLMVVGLVEMPWPFLLMLLIGGLYSLQKLSLQSYAFMDTQATQQDPGHLKGGDEQKQSTGTQTTVNVEQTHDALRYRGVRYSQEQPAMPIESTDNDSPRPVLPQPIQGKYRGQQWQRSPLSEPTPTASSEIKYRGHKVIQPQSSDRPTA